MKKQSNILFTFLTKALFLIAVTYSINFSHLQATHTFEKMCVRIANENKFPAQNIVDRLSSFGWPYGLLYAGTLIYLTNKYITQRFIRNTDLADQGVVLSVPLAFALHTALQLTLENIS